MSTSKENWDHLVYLDGNYGIDISKGIWPGSGQQPGIKGDKGDDGYGEKGAKGQKGQPGVNGSDGGQGQAGSKGAPGAQGAKGGKGDIGPKGNIGFKGQKGHKGEGDKGEKGEAAATPVFVFQGEVATFNDLPTNANVGDVYQTADNDFLYAWDGTEWVTIAEAIGVVKGEPGDKGQKGVDGFDGGKGNQGTKGQKGAGGGQGFKGTKGDAASKGEKGQKGGKGEPGQDGTDGTNGNKGEKGQKGDTIDSSIYYTKGETDFLIQDFRAPQFAFDVDAYPLSGNPAVNPNKIVSGTVDFDSVNQADPVYNSGIVVIGSGATINNSPIAAPELLVVNYISINAGDLRGTDYALLQYAFSNTDAAGDALGYWRFVQPAQGRFGAWNLSQFPASNYYTKAEVDGKIRTYNLASTQGSDDTKTLIRLTDSDGSISGVNINVSGGLSAVSTNNNVITIDASAISGNVTFEGGIAAADPSANPPIVAQDPATLDPTPNGGDYFIFTNAGTAWNGDAVTEGDWAIYRATDTTWVTLDYQTSTIGVASVDVAGGLLTKTGTATDPTIGLTAQTIEDEVLGDYVTNEQLGASLRDIVLGDLADVNILDSTTFTPANLQFAQYNDQLADNTAPLAAGQYSVIPRQNTIWFNQSSINNPTSFYINFMLQNAAAGDKFIIKANDGSWQQVVTFVSYTQPASPNNGTRKFVIAEASGVGAVNGYTGTWSIRGRIVSAGLNNEAILRYNSTSNQWEVSTAYTRTEAETAFLSKPFGGTVEGNLIIAANKQNLASNSFILQGRITTNGSVTANLLKTFIRGSGDTQPDYIQYFGQTSPSDSIQTQASVAAALESYLPLTAGSAKKLTGDLHVLNDHIYVEDSNGATRIDLSPTGTVQMGQFLSMYQSVAAAYGINVGHTASGSETSANSYIDIRTTDNNGGIGTFGTVRIGQTSSTASFFIQCYTPGSTTPVLRVRNTTGIIECPQSSGTFSSLTNGQLPTKKQVKEEIQASATAGIPIGSIMAWPGGGQPQGWLKMNGQSYDVASNPVLDSVLSQMAGYVQGTVPDWKGLHLVAYGGSFSESLGTIIGSRTAMPNLPFGTATDGEHFHKYGSSDRYGGGTTKSAYDAQPRLNSFNTTTAGAHVHTITGGDPVTNPPCAVIQWIIKIDD